MWIRCVYCGEHFSEILRASREHIIPEFLGGFLWERFACIKCNSDLGNEIDAEWQKNHEVIRALSDLEMPIDPNVFKTAQVSSLDPGKPPQYELVRYGETKSPFFVDRSRNSVNIDRDSLNDRKKGIQAISGMIEKDHKMPKEEAIKVAQEVVDAMRKVEVGQIKKVEKILPNKKLTFTVKPHVIEGKLNMCDHFRSNLPIRLPIKIAYSFAAILLQDDIFQKDYEKFRRFLRFPDSTEKVRALPLSTVWEYMGPKHILGVRARHGKLYVILIFFNCMPIIVELGPESGVTDVQCCFDIKNRTAGFCHFAPGTEGKLNKIFEEAF